MARHAIHDVFERITTRAPFIRPRALELFCGSGKGQAVEYAPLCEYLEGWDMREEQIAEFRRNIPSAQAKVCDVYKAVAELRDPGGFNVVLVDNPALIAQHFEHFDLFPGIFKLMAPGTCFVVFGVYPDPFSYAEPRKQAIREAFADPDGFMADWDAARDRFYGLPPMDPNNLPKPRPISAIRLDAMEGIYREKFLAAGFEVPYTFSCMRGRAAGYVLVEAKQKAIEIDEPKHKKRPSKGLGPLGGVLGGRL